MTRKQWMIIGGLGTVVAICFVCSTCLILSMMMNPSSASPQSNQQVVESEATSVPQQPVVSRATSTPKPTDTPKPTATPSPLPTQSVGKVGDKMQSAGIAITVNKVSKANQINQFLKPKAGNVYLVLDVLIENVSRDEETPYNPLYFLLKDADSFDYNESLTAPDPSLKSGTLRKGDKARGNVAFEVPTSAKGFTVRYEPMVLFGGYQPIRIGLGQ